MNAGKRPEGKTNERVMKMINLALREARMNRITSFMLDVEAIYKAMTAGKTVRSRIDKLRNYSLSLTAAKSDDYLRPLATACEQLLDTITDGKPFEADKNHMGGY
jgi:hypothetical protein